MPEQYIRMHDTKQPESKMGDCALCGHPVKRRGKKYCSKACYRAVPVSSETRAKMSAASKGKPKAEGHRANIVAATKGKPKPWNNGERNPNFGNKEQGKPEVRARFLKAVAERGQCWTDEQKAAHAELMRGNANAMTGRRHTAETKAAVSSAKIKQYREGSVSLRNFRVSRAEAEIGEFLVGLGLDVIPQFHIKGVGFYYDFCIPSLSLVVEYQGDYWHANPAKYSAGTMLKIQNLGLVLVDDIWARDARKKNEAEQRGYRVIYVWESDFKAKGMEAVKCHIKAH